LRRQEFVLVPPGAKLDPYQHIDHYGFFSSHALRAQSFPVPGEYRIRFHYSTAEREVGDWLGDWPLRATSQMNEMAELLGRVPNVTFVTEVSVRITRRAE
jgi:hypothetical protein